MKTFLLRHRIAVLLLAAILAVGVVSPAVGGPSPVKIAKKALKKSKKSGKKAKKAKKKANAAQKTADAALAAAAAAAADADQAKSQSSDALQVASDARPRFAYVTQNGVLRFNHGASSASSFVTGSYIVRWDDPLDDCAISAMAGVGRPHSGGSQDTDAIVAANVSGQKQLDLIVTDKDGGFIESAVFVIVAC